MSRGAEAGIRALTRRLEEATRRAELDAVADCFTDDALYLRPGEPADRGRPQIRGHWEEALEVFAIDLSWSIGEIVVSGDLGYVLGRVVFRGIPRRGGDEKTIRNRYLWILRREEDGHWRIARYIRNETGG